MSVVVVVVVVIVVVVVVIVVVTVVAAATVVVPVVAAAVVAIIVIVDPAAASGVMVIVLLLLLLLLSSSELTNDGFQLYILLLEDVKSVSGISASLEDLIQCLLQLRSLHRVEGKGNSRKNCRQKWGQQKRSITW